MAVSSLWGRIGRGKLVKRRHLVLQHLELRWARTSSQFATVHEHLPQASCYNASELLLIQRRLLLTGMDRDPTVRDICI